MTNFILNTNKGYICGSAYNKEYKMEELAKVGWHTSGGVTYTKLIFGEKEKAKEYYYRNISAIMQKLHYLIDNELENIEYINVEVIKTKKKTSKRCLDKLNKLYKRAVENGYDETAEQIKKDIEELKK